MVMVGHVFLSVFVQLQPAAHLREGRNLRQYHWYQYRFRLSCARESREKGTGLCCHCTVILTICCAQKRGRRGVNLARLPALDQARVVGTRCHCCCWLRTGVKMPQLLHSSTFIHPATTIVYLQALLGCWLRVAVNAFPAGFAGAWVCGSDGLAAAAGAEGHVPAFPESAGLG